MVNDAYAPELLRSLFLYDPVTGRLHHKVDHINGIRDDNRLCNLRLVTQRENDQNRRKARGYSWNKGCSKWEAYIRVDGVLRYLGLFTTEAAARAAYLKAKARYHPTTPADLLRAA